MIGRTLAHFRILEKIGEGGMGVVYRAEDQRLHRPVALKILPPEVLGNEERRLRFLREARAAAAVSDPHIATVYDIGEVDGVVFIAMEVVEGRTLRSLLAGRPLPVRQAVDIALQVAQGLEKAHRAHVIHRDLKPDNIVVGPDGQAKILDFGLAKLLEDDEEKSNAEVSRLRTISREMTRAGKILGTAAYMSPEQARGEAIDARSDLFSFGVTLYEMVTGRQPFQGRTDTDILIAIVRDGPTPPAQVNPEVPPELERIIAECLEKEPADRYQHADQVAVDLRKLKRSSDTGLQKVQTPPATPAVPGVGWAGALHDRKGWRVLLASGAAVLLVGLGLTAWSLRPAPVRFRQGDRILVTDLENDTGRAEVGATLRLALEERLMKSSYARPIVGEARDRLAATSAGETSHVLSPEAAEDACTRKECAAYLTGAVASDGPAFRMMVALHVVGGGHPFKEWTVAVPAEDGLLQAIHDLALDVRRALGETPQAVAGTPPPTSRSLPAYEAYATSFLSPVDNQNAIALMKRAIEIDPEFTDAYMALSFNDWNLGDFKEWRRLAREAVRLSEGRSEQTSLMNEMNLLEATYDIDRLMERTKAYTRLYPFDPMGQIYLGLNYEIYYQNVSAAETAHRAAYRLLADETTFGNLSGTLRAQDRAGQIEELVADYRSRGGDEYAARLGKARAHLARGDQNGAEETLLPLLQGASYHRLTATMMKVSSLVFAGRINEAEQASADAWRLAVEQGDLRAQHGLGMERVWLALHRTGVASSPSDEELRMARSDLRHLRDLAALSVDTRLAEPLGRLTREHEEYEKDNPSQYVRDTFQFVHACQDLVRGDAARAVDLLTPLARNSDLVAFHHVLGRALEAGGQWQAAAAAYEDTLRHRYSRYYLFSWAAWILDQHRLAGIYQRLGDRPRARQWYEKFLADWKDGDPDIPEIIEARKRVQELAGEDTVVDPPAERSAR